MLGLKVCTTMPDWHALLKRIPGILNVQLGWNYTQWFCKRTWSLTLISNCSGWIISILRYEYLYSKHNSSFHSPSFCHIYLLSQKVIYVICNLTLFPQQKTDLTHCLSLSHIHFPLLSFLFSFNKGYMNYRLNINLSYFHQAMKVHNFNPSRGR